MFTRKFYVINNFYVVSIFEIVDYNDYYDYNIIIVIPSTTTIFFNFIL